MIVRECHGIMGFYAGSEQCRFWEWERFCKFEDIVGMFLSTTSVFEQAMAYNTLKIPTPIPTLKEQFEIYVQRNYRSSALRVIWHSALCLLMISAVCSFVPFSLTGQIVTTLAGTENDFADGVGANARFSYPQDVCTDGAGTSTSRTNTTIGFGKS
jgi:hypothetical protein